MKGLRPERPSPEECWVLEVSDDLWSLIERCWKQAPVERPSMAQVALELKKWEIPFSEDDETDTAYWDGMKIILLLEFIHDVYARLELNAIRRTPSLVFDDLGSSRLSSSFNTPAQRALDLKPSEILNNKRFSSESRGSLLDFDRLGLNDVSDSVEGLPHALSRRSVPESLDFDIETFQPRSSDATPRENKLFQE